MRVSNTPSCSLITREILSSKEPHNHSTQLRRCESQRMRTRCPLDDLPIDDQAQDTYIVSLSLSLLHLYKLFAYVAVCGFASRRRCQRVLTLQICVIQWIYLSLLLVFVPVQRRLQSVTKKQSKRTVAASRRAKRHALKIEILTVTVRRNNNGLRDCMGMH